MIREPLSFDAALRLVLEARRHHRNVASRRAVACFSRLLAKGPRPRIRRAP